MSVWSSVGCICLSCLLQFLCADGSCVKLRRRCSGRWSTEPWTTSKTPATSWMRCCRNWRYKCLLFFLLCVVLHAIWFLLTVQFVMRCVCPAELWPGEEGRWVRRGGGRIEGRKSRTAMKREIHQADHLVVIEPKLGPLWKKKYKVTLTVQDFLSWMPWVDNTAWPSQMSVVGVFCFVPTSLYEVVGRSGWWPQCISR